MDPTRETSSDRVADGPGAAPIDAAALLGAGYWSLVIQQLALAITLASGAWIACDWLNRNGWESPL